MDTTTATPQEIHRILERDVLMDVQKPARYLGGEMNSIRKDPDRVEVSFALLFPDLYELGMSHLGYQILYAIINELPWAAAERAYAVWPDMQEQMAAHGIPLYALESFRPVRQFDVAGFSLQHEMLYTNVLRMLELAGIPVESVDRRQEDPVVIAGGPGAANPEPMADFIDLFFVGEAEETIVEFARLVRRLKAQRASREAIVLEAARTIPSLYAPAHYAVEYRQDGTVAHIRPTAEGLPERIRAAKVEHLDRAPFPTRPIVPFVETVHDRITLEIQRGCTRGCRFCQAGMLSRPGRVRSADRLVEQARESYASTGHSEIALCSLSASDHPEIETLMRRLVKVFEPLSVNISLPSLRVSQQLTLLPELLGAVRRSGFTIAPEAATERLRRVINKDVSEDELLSGVEAAYREGWRLIKLYFMIGLPTETTEDAVAVVDLSERVSRLRGKVAGGAGTVNVSVSPFVPKPHTPFQWEPMAAPQRVSELIAVMKDRLRMRNVRLKHHMPERSFVEAALSRGDRRLGKVIKRVRQRGGQFDEWDECFSFAHWAEAFAQEGLTIEFYATRARALDEVLPWDHIDPGVKKEYLLAERERAFAAELTPDCKLTSCRRCGACASLHTP